MEEMMIAIIQLQLEINKTQATLLEIKEILN